MSAAKVIKKVAVRKPVKKSTPSLLNFLTPKATEALARKVRAKANARDLIAWCASDEGFRQLGELAKKYRKFALLKGEEYEDLRSMVAVQLIELKNGPTSEAEFAPWLLAIVKKTAGGMRNEKLRERTGSVDCDILQATIVCPSSVAETEGFEFAADQKKHDKNLAARVKRAIKSLPPAMQAVLKDKYFHNLNLSDAAKKDGKSLACYRMRLLRAKAKLATLIDSSGYALAA